MANATVDASGFETVDARFSNAWAIEVFGAEPAIPTLFGFSSANVKGGQPLSLFLKFGSWFTYFSVKGR